jgi:hypothetical protein
MKSEYIPIAFAFLSIATLAQTETTTSPAPQAFESPGRVETKMFIPAGLMSGPLHSVGGFRRKRRDEQHLFPLLWKRRVGSDDWHRPAHADPRDLRNR